MFRWEPSKIQQWKKSCHIFVYWIISPLKYIHVIPFTHSTYVQIVNLLNKEKNISLSSDLHRDLGIEAVTDIIAKFAKSHEKRLQDHINIEASRFLNVNSITWSSGQSSWLLTQRSRVRFPTLPDCLRSSGPSTGSTLLHNITRRLKRKKPFELVRR
jgi:hypothetical protein